MFTHAGPAQSGSTGSGSGPSGTGPSGLGKVRDSRSLPVVTALVDQGFLDPARQDEAVAVVDRTLGGQAVAESSTLRHRLAELAGYVGGAFVVSAAALFISDQWNDLSTGQRVGLLGGIAVLLAIAGVILALTGGGFTALRAGAQPVRRRLGGALFAGSAASAAIAVLVQLDSTREGDEALPGLGAALTLVVLGAVGYYLAPTVLGQVVIAYGAVTSVPQALQALDISEAVEFGGPDPVVFGLVVLAIGLVWLALAEKGVWREVQVARVIGAAIAVIGAQIPLGSDTAWVAYVATALVAAAGFAMYVVTRAWPYLAVGVVGVTLAVPEALLDWFEGAMGPAGVLLAAGVTLLAASLLGLRLRQEVTENASGEGAA